MIELTARALGALRRSTLIWAIALLALTASVLALWPSLRNSGSLDSLVDGLSPELISALGLESLASPAGFLEGNLYALLLPLLLAAFTIMSTVSLTAGDEDAGRLELLLALPIGRASVYFARFIAVTLMTLLITALLTITVLASAPALDMELRTEGVIAANGGLLLLALMHGALALALAGLGLRAGAVLGLTFTMLALGYLAHAFLPMVESLSDAAIASPWNWAFGEAPLEHGISAPGFIALLVATVLLTAIGLLGVRRRTIRTA